MRLTLLTKSRSKPLDSGAARGETLCKSQSVCVSVICGYMATTGEKEEYNKRKSAIKFKVNKLYCDECLMKIPKTHPRQFSRRNTAVSVLSIPTWLNGLKHLLCLKMECPYTDISLQDNISTVVGLINGNRMSFFHSELH